MHSAVPKQFLPIGGRPALMHAFDAFLDYASAIRFVLALPEPFHNDWKTMCRENNFAVQHELVNSGPTRFHSVKNGLKQIPDNALVAIHDGARPLVSPDLVSSVFRFAEKFGNAIPVISPDDSVRMTDHALSSPLPRDRVRLVQTPQCFRSTIIKKAYNKNYHASFTDDASVFEAESERLFLVDGERTNVKITTQTDLIIAEALLAGKTR